MMIEICRSLDLINDWLESMVMAVQHSKLAKDGAGKPCITDPTETLQRCLNLNGGIVWRMPFIFIAGGCVVWCFLPLIS